VVSILDVEHAYEDILGQTTWLSCTETQYVLPGIGLILTAILLKKYQEGQQTKKAAIFEFDDYFRYMREAPNEGEHLTDKCVSIVALFGGLRGQEYTPLKWEKLKLESSGWWVTFSTVKRRGKNKGGTDRFLIPYDPNGPYCPASLLTT
jgi:integrase